MKSGCIGAFGKIQKRGVVVEHRQQSSVRRRRR